jgi:elongation factor Ts
MEITLDLIQDLRSRTGISISECKKALVETGGDIEKSIEELKKKGVIKLAKKSDRDTKEGRIGIAYDDKRIAIIEVDCETDFVAKNEDFIKTVNDIAQKALALDESTVIGNQDLLGELSLKMGENIKISRAKFLDSANTASYVHLTGKIGVVVKFSNTIDGDIAKGIAMQVAANNPIAVKPEDISADIIAKEKEIWAELLKNEGKPEVAWGKIMEGKERKFKEDSALYPQEFLLDPSKKVKDALSGNEVVEMIRFEI